MYKCRCQICCIRHTAHSKKKVIALSFFTGVQQQDGVNSRTLLRKLDRVIGIKYLHDLSI